MLKRLTLILTFAIVTLLAAATLLQRFFGQDWVRLHIYQSIWFYAVWAAFGILTVIMRAGKRTSHNTPATLLHLSVLTILTGAGVTGIWSERGTMHLRTGESGSLIYSDRSEVLTLPFQITLLEFEPHYHGNGSTPANYSSRLEIKWHGEENHTQHTVAINHIHRERRFRICQTGFDQDLSGATFSMSDDPVGITVTYMGYCLFLLSVCMLHFSRRRAGRERAGGALFGKKLRVTLAVVEYSLLISLSAAIILRWHMGGHIPLASSYDTLLFLAFMVLLITIPVKREVSLLQLTGTLISCATILAANIFGLESDVEPLSPMLNSPLLGFHVAVIMTSYALLFIIAINSMLALTLQKRRSAELTELSRSLLYPALSLSGAGIILGSVWANLSWGRYWGWDPKEVWALITFMLYGLGVHRKTLHFINDDRGFNLFMLLSFAALIMTYWGVNYLIGGLHSYI